jgi:outer membrane receptor protein involved in Fe transport
MKQDIKKRLFLGVAALTIAMPAAAQTVEPDASSGRDEIIVTAQKRDQRLIEVPQSISVVGEKVLDRLNATSFQDYLALVPGLQLNQDTPGAGRLILRGVNTGGVASTVAVYVDETPFGSSTGLVNAGVLAGDFDTFDIQRIEVLRGPQGTVYGANSLGGVLKFVTNKPEFDALRGRLKVGTETVKGGDVGFSGAGMINVPLSETVAFRASGAYRDVGGFIDSTGANGSDIAEDINGSTVYSGRASLLIEPSDNLSVRLSAVMQNIDTDEASLVNIDATSLKPLNNALTRDRYTDATNKVEYRVYNGTVDHELGGMTFTSSTSYSTFDQAAENDFMSFSLAGLVAGALGAPPIELILDQQTDQRKFTQEFRLTSDEDDTFEWQLGAYYTRETGLISQIVTANKVGTSITEPAVPVLADVTLDSVYKEYAGFANATFHVSDRFDLIFGGRYSQNEQTVDQSTDGLPGLFVGAPEVLPTAGSDEGVFTWSIAPRFEVDANTFLYARVAKGFRPGGPNALPPNLPAGTPRTYASDTTLSYEVGVKTRSDDDRLSLDASVFYTDWNNVQLFAVINGFGVNTNAGGARVFGGEFTASFTPTDELHLVLNGAYTDAELTTDTDPLVVGALDGDTLPFTPKFVLGLSADYEVPISADKTAFFGGTLRYQTKQTSNFSPAGRSEFSDYANLDLRMGLLMGAYTAEIFARNITNVHGYTSGGTPDSNLPAGVLNAGVTRPQSFGISLTVDF